MTACRWTRQDLDRRLDPVLFDELQDTPVLVLEGVDASDDGRLGWCRRAPCVVVARPPAGARPPANVDVVVEDGPGPDLDEVVEAVVAHPMAARTLVEVLRVVPALEVDQGLTVESLAYSVLLAGAEFRTWVAQQPTRRPRAWAGSPVRVDRDGDVLQVTLARPSVRNALSAEVRDGLFGALQVVELDDSLSVVLDAEGPVFCSGGDLAEFGSAEDVVRAHQIRTLRSVGAVLHRLADRATVHVQGACVGAGVELCAFAGQVVAEPDATFRLPEVAMGLIPGAGGTVSISRRIGRRATAALALTGRELDASSALELGLVDEVRGS